MGLESLNLIRPGMSGVPAGMGREKMEGAAIQANATSQPMFPPQPMGQMVAQEGANRPRLDMLM